MLTSLKCKLSIVSYTLMFIHNFYDGVFWIIGTLSLLVFNCPTDIAYSLKDLCVWVVNCTSGMPLKGVNGLENIDFCVIPILLRTDASIF